MHYYCSAELTISADSYVCLLKQTHVAMEALHANGSKHKKYMQNHIPGFGSIIISYTRPA